MIKIYMIFLFILFVVFESNAQIIGPEPDSVCVGDTATFSITVMTFDSVKWEFSTTTTGPWNEPPVPTVDRIDTLVINVNDVELYDDDYFRAIVWVEGNVDTSDSAVLTIFDLP